MAVQAVKVSGLRQLQAGFRNLDRGLGRELQVSLREAAEPVRLTAQQLASARIRNIGDRWSQMKVGSTTRVVYVAPAARKRRHGSPRPNLAGLLMGRAMEPALEMRSGEVVQRVDRLLGVLAGENGF